MKRLHAVAGLAAWPLVLASSAAAQEPSGFEWRVKDRFRLFDQASQGARDKVDALLAELQASDAALAEHYDAYLHVLSDAGQAAGHPAELRRSNYRPAGDEVGRTSGRYDERYLYPDSYAVELRNTALTGRTCSYYAGLTERTAPCGEWAAVTMPSGNGAERYAGVHGQVLITIDDGRTLSEPIAFRDETIVALGDSFISGEGNPDRPSMLNPDDPEKIFERPSWGGKAELGPHVVRAAQWWDEPCHRSLLSWPVLASLAYAALDEQRAVTLVHLGCSGAIVDDLIAHGEVDLPGGGDETESQLQLLDGLLQRPTAAWRRREVDKYCCRSAATISASSAS